MVKDITVVDTNYTEYALVLKHKVFNREYTQVALYGERSTRARLRFSFTSEEKSRNASPPRVCRCVFAGRTQSVKNNIIQRFKAFALSQGFPRESILTPPLAGKSRRVHGACVHTHTHVGHINELKLFFKICFA